MPEVPNSMSQIENLPERDEVMEDKTNGKLEMNFRKRNEIIKKHLGVNYYHIGELHNSIDDAMIDVMKDTKQSIIELIDEINKRLDKEDRSNPVKDYYYDDFIVRIKKEILTELKGKIEAL